MTAGITEYDRTAFAFKPAWWGFHTVVDHLMNEEEALELALNWEPVHRPLALWESWNWSDALKKSPSPLGKWQANVRDDTEAVLGIVGMKHKNLGNAQLAKTLCDITEAAGLGRSRLETIGSLFGGDEVFLSANLGDWAIARKYANHADEFKSYLILIAGHNGVKAANLLKSDMRVVCSNTSNFALEGALKDKFSSQLQRIVHTKNADERLETAKEVLSHHLHYQKLLQGSLEKLENDDFSIKQVVEWAGHTLVDADVFIGDINTLERYANRNWNPVRNRHMITPGERMVKAATHIGDLFENGVGNYGKTKCDAINGLTEFLDHHHERFKQAKDQNTYASKRFLDTLLGDSAKVRTRGLKNLQRW